jgi:hypothetical protein
VPPAGSSLRTAAASPFTHALCRIVGLMFDMIVLDRGGGAPRRGRRWHARGGVRQATTIRPGMLQKQGCCLRRLIFLGFPMKMTTPSVFS